MKLGYIKITITWVYIHFADIKIKINNKRLRTLFDTEEYWQKENWA